MAVIARHLPRSAFRYRPERKFTTRFGLLTPYFYRSVIAGDKVAIRLAQITKTEAMATPTLHDVYVKNYFMFVPNRLLQKDWKDWRTGGANDGTYGQDKETGDFTLVPIRGVSKFAQNSDINRDTIVTYAGIVLTPSPIGWRTTVSAWSQDDDMPVLPRVTYPSDTDASAWDNHVGYYLVSHQPNLHSVADYFGFPRRVSTQSEGAPALNSDFRFNDQPNLFPFMAYWLCWNEFFRDPDLQDPIPLAHAETSGVVAGPSSAYVNAIKDTTDWNSMRDDREPSMSDTIDGCLPYMATLDAFRHLHSKGIKASNTTYLRGLQADRGIIDPWYPLMINWERDYFLGARPWAVRGVSPVLPLGDIAVSVNNLNVNSVFHGAQQTIAGTIEGSDLSLSMNSIPETDVVLKHYGEDGNTVDANSVIASNLSANPDFPRRQTIGKLDAGYGSSVDEVPTGGYGVLMTPKVTPTGSIGGTASFSTTLQPVGTITNTASGTATGAGSVLLDIAELQIALRMQNYLERLACTNGRYQDYLLALFGIAPEDRSLQRPAFIGGTRRALLVQEVTQTAPDSGSTTGDGVAEIYGKGLHQQSGNIGSFTATEDGFIIALYVAYPRLEWNPQGIDRELLRRNRYDYFNPMFDKLPAQGIEKRELYLESYDEDYHGEDVYAYRNRWDEMRMYESQSVAGFRDEYDDWTLNRKLSGVPDLNGAFIQMDCQRDELSRIFKVQNQDTLKVESLIDMVIYRSMTETGIRSI